MFKSEFQIGTSGLMKEGRVLNSGPAQDVFTSENLEAAYHWPLEIDTNLVTGAPCVTARPQRG